VQSNLNLTFETLENGAGFMLTTPSSSSASVYFEDAPDDYLIGQTPDALIMQLSSEIRVTVFSDDGIVLYMSKDSEVPQSFTLRFENVHQIDSSDASLVLHVENTHIYVEFSDCYVANLDSDNLTVTMQGAEAKMEFKISDKAQNMSLRNVMFQSVDGNRLLIPSSKRIPEFIISIYDDADFKRPRPSRFGVPVISTVPGFVPDEWWGVDTPVVDKDLMELGVGTEKRKMYFRVISDQNIDVSLRNSLRMEIDMPAGVDTVVETVSIPLIYNGTSSGSLDTNDVFEGDYDFHVEDTVQYVDGFAYLSVKLPLRVQRNLPLVFQVSTDGTSFPSNPGTVQGAEVIDELSIGPVVVQSKEANSTQGSEASTSKNSKNGRKPKA